MSDWRIVDLPLCETPGCGGGRTHRVIEEVEQGRTVWPTRKGDYCSSCADAVLAQKRPTSK